MTDAEYQHTLEELDRLLNDPDVPMQPARVWTLLAEISRHDHVGPATLPAAPRSGTPGSLPAP